MTSECLDVKSEPMNMSIRRHGQVPKVVFAFLSIVRMYVEHMSFVLNISLRVCFLSILQVAIPNFSGTRGLDIREPLVH